MIKDMFFFTGYFAFISNQMKTWLEKFVSSYFIILAYYIQKTMKWNIWLPHKKNKNFSEFETF